MTLDKRIETSAYRIWNAIQEHRRLIIPSAHRFTAKSLWVIDNLLVSDEQHKPGGLLFFGEDEQSPVSNMQRQQRIFEIGAYVGEVVRSYHGENCKWGERGNDEFRLHWPDREPIFPMQCIEDRIRNYETGSIIKWGEDAGLHVGKRQDKPTVSFRPKTD